MNSFIIIIIEKNGISSLFEFHRLKMIFQPIISVGHQFNYRVRPFILFLNVYRLIPKPLFFSSKDPIVSICNFS